MPSLTRLSPTVFHEYTHLTATEKRIFWLRDWLNCHTPSHLDTFLRNLSDPEPPVYRFVNGTIEPPLSSVRARSEIRCLDVGYVRVRGNGDGEGEENKTWVTRCEIAVLGQGEGCVLRESEMADEEEQDGETDEAIDETVALELAQLYEGKISAISARVHQINKERRKAYQVAERKSNRPSSETQPYPDDPPSNEHVIQSVETSESRASALFTCRRVFAF
jgi:hypothetical protein